MSDIYESKVNEFPYECTACGERGSIKMIFEAEELKCLRVHHDRIGATIANARCRNCGNYALKLNRSWKFINLNNAMCRCVLCDWHGMLHEVSTRKARENILVCPKCNIPSIIGAPACE